MIAGRVPIIRPVNPRRSNLHLGQQPRAGEKEIDPGILVGSSPVMSPAIAGRIDARQFGEKPGSSASPRHLLKKRFIPDGIEVPITNDVRFRIRRKDAIEMLTKLLSLESPDERFSLRNGQSGF